MAFTWAVTVTFWGENSAVGAGTEAAIAAMALLRGAGAKTRIFYETSTDA